MKGKLAEITLHLANLIYFLFGLTVLVFGIICLASPQTIVDLFSYIPGYDQLKLVVDVEGLTLGPSIYLTCMGSIIVVKIMFGSGGVAKGKPLIVLLYGVITLAMMLFNMAVIIFYAVDPYFIQPNVESNMNKSLIANFQPVNIDANGAIIPPTDESANAWVTMQFEQGCCGVSGFEDFSYFEWNNTFPTVSVLNAKVPPSCCMQIVQHKIAKDVSDFVNLATCMRNPPQYANNKGCSDYLMQQITRYNFVYVVTAAAIEAVQAIILALTMFLLAVKGSSILGIV